MAKVRTEQITIDHKEGGKLQFKYDIYVNKDGTFATTLPEDITKLFDDAGVDLSRNQIKKKGYFTAKACDNLCEQVKDVCLLYMSRKMISEKIVIQYVIQTQCSYAFDQEGNVAPNPDREWTGMDYDNNPNNRWHQGTIDIDATHNLSFGFQIYAMPFVRRDYQYRSGKVKIEYARMYEDSEICYKALETGYFLRWLHAVPCISPPAGRLLGIKEIDYTENVAEFFVNMIKSICIMNEKIKDFLEPDSIKMIADKKMKFLI
ncbi:MAG: hypothetical protein PHT07_15570 [Paludibacter sp.]|nr:hypothetical protein [Paludibacter sp.]